MQRNSDSKSWLTGRAESAFTLVVSVLIAVLVLAACGGDPEGADDAAEGEATSAAIDTGASEPTSGSSEPAAGGQLPDVEYARERIEQYRQVPEFEAVGDPVDVPSLGGKTIFNIPLSSDIPFCADMDAAMADIAEEAGLEFIEFENQGQSSEWVRGMEQATSQGVDIISLQCGIQPDTLGPQIAAAQQAGIPVVASHFQDPSMEVPEVLDAAVMAEFVLSAKLDVDYAISSLDGEPVHLLVFTSNEIVPAPEMVQAVEDEMEQYCGPECTTTVVNVPGSGWGTDLQPATQSALLANPDINWVLPLFDSMMIAVVPGIEAVGRDGDVQVSTFNGTPDMLDMQASKEVIVANVAENTDWLAHTNMDQIFRVLADMPPLENRSGPIRIIDETNIDETGPDFTEGFGDEFESGFRSHWGME